MDEVGNRICRAAQDSKIQYGIKICDDEVSLYSVSGVGGNWDVDERLTIHTLSLASFTEKIEKSNLDFSKMKSLIVTC